MPSARVKIATPVNPGDLRNMRRPKCKSCMKSSIQLTLRASRHFSLVFSIPPRSIRARRCASSWVIPCATYSSVFRSRWSRSSSSNSWSACAQRNNDRNRSGIVYSQCSGRIFDSPLLVPQSDHRIDFHRSARGNVASSESDENQQGGDGHHRERIVRADVIQHRRHETRDAYSGGDADGCADEREQNPLPDNEARDIAMVRAEGHANAELAGAASDFVGQQTVKADAGQHQREGSEETG